MDLKLKTADGRQNKTRRKPEPAQTLLDQAIALHEKRQFAEAEALLARLTSEFPGDFLMWNARGVNLRSLKRFESAVWCFREAIGIAPQNAAVWFNLGNVLVDLKHIESAITCHHRAIALKPGEAGSHHNLALALTAADRHVEALAALDRAVELDPADPNIRWDRGRSYLHLGDYGRGWPEYEARLTTGQLPKRRAPGPRWTGQRYDDKRLLILSEQGFGDAIWIARYLRQVKALGGELVMECRPELIPLIAGMNVVDRLVAKGDPLPQADFHIHQCSLPGLYTAGFASIPRAPYLQPDRQRLAKFAAAMDRGKGKLRVGIVWSGSVTFEANGDRAVALRMFLQWFTLPGVQLYSLQKGPPETELTSMPEGAPIIDLAPLLDDFADTAAAISQLDLILMTDSAVVHLAGAIGKPVWALLNFMPHWQWLSDRTDSPWYPSARLFRQRAWGDWTGVFDRAAAELIKWSDANRRRH